MWLTRAGGALLVLGFLPAGIWVLRGGGIIDNVGPGWDTALVVAFCGLLGAGSAALAAHGAPQLDGRLTRAGLALAAVGLLAVAIGRTVIVIPAGSNDLQSWPFIIFVLGGGLAGILGWVLTGLGLVRSAGWPRLIGVLLLAGVASLGLAGGLMSPPIWVAIGPIGILALGLVALGAAGPDSNRGGV